MGKPDDGHKIVEGDASAVPVQIAPGEASDAPRRPAKGTQLVWGGGDPSSPWGHLQSLIDAAGGSVQYTLLHSSVLAQLAKGHKPAPPAQHQSPEQQQQQEDAHQEQHEHNISHVVAATGDPYGTGLDFEFDNKKQDDARVWAHPAAPLACKVPLLVFLHGVARRDFPEMDCNFPQLQVNFHEHPFACHLGRLAKALIDGGKARPLAIAAPTAHDNKSAEHLWKSFDLSLFVKRVAEELHHFGVAIDYDEVIVAGHSGAGCHGKTGLYKVANERGEFQAEGNTHRIRVLGFADTCASRALAPLAAAGLTDKTALYATFQGDGGGGPGTRDRHVDAKHPSYEEAYGCTIPKQLVASDPESAREYDEFVWDGKDPGRYVLHFSADHAASSIFAHEKEWITAVAIEKAWPKTGAGSGWAKHYGMTMVWTWYALQRFWHARDGDKEIVRKYHEQQRSKPEEHDEKAVPKTSGGSLGPDWDQVPAAPPPWKAPGVRPKANLPLQAADPTTGRFWPVRTRSSYGRAVAFLGEDSRAYGGGPASDPTAQRHFLAERKLEDQAWYNGGVDLYADFGDTVVAAEGGEILRFEQLHAGVHKLLVRCTSGLVIHYGGVDPGSLESFGLKVGDLVRAGQPVAHVGRMEGGQPVLHFETYVDGTKDVAACLGTSSASFLDPTDYLLNLAVRGL